MKNVSNPKIHTIRFYNPKPNAVFCMALQPVENKLAVSRSDASIEIWNITDSPFIERRIASSTENFSIEGLAWCGSRLFSVGLHGLLIEYDLFKLDMRSRAVVTGEAAFCLDINKQGTQIAIGTEQGYLNIFQITEDEVLFEKFLDKQEGRILCLKFDSTGEYVVSGSMDAIRIWSVRTNQALHKMTPGRSEHHKPTIVWCLAVTDEFIIISGDSRGILTVWDGKVGAQLESYQSHKADILSICLSEDQNSLYSSGVDPTIVNYVRVTVTDDTRKWVRSIHRKIHDHDVRALILNGEKVYSGGVDGYLACSYHPPKTFLKYPPILPSTCINIATTSRFVMLRYPDFIEIWSLGTSTGRKDKQTGLYTIQNEPKKLIVLQKIVKVDYDDDDDEKKEGIICAAISDDGKFILYSTRLGIRLLKLVFNEDKPKLVPMEMLDEFEKTPCVHAIFTDNNRLIIAPNTGGLQVFNVDNVTLHLVQSINTQLHDTVTLLTSSSTYLAAGDAAGNISVWFLKRDQYQLYYNLPKYKSFPNAINIHPRLLNLVVVYSDGKIMEYDLKKKRLTNFSRSLAEDAKIQDRNCVFRNITFDPRQDDVIIVHDDDSAIVADRSKLQKMSNGKPKIRKIDTTESSDEKSQMHQKVFRVIKKNRHLVHLSWLSDDEMVAVEVNPLSLIEQLPPVLVQNTFGRK